MTTAAGDIAITRPDGLLASYAVPGQPERLVALKRRDITELITEELRRMDADQVYERRSSLVTGEERPADAPSRRRGRAEEGGGQEDGREDGRGRKMTGGTAGAVREPEIVVPAPTTWPRPWPRG